MNLSAETFVYWYGKEADPDTVIPVFLWARIVFIGLCAHTPICVIMDERGKRTPLKTASLTTGTVALRLPFTNTELPVT